MGIYQPWVKVRIKCFVQICCSESVPWRLAAFDIVIKEAFVDTELNLTTHHSESTIPTRSFGYTARHLIACISVSGDGVNIFFFLTSKDEPNEH